MTRIYDTSCCSRSLLKTVILSVIELMHTLHNLVLSTGLIMWICQRKEIQKLTFRALARLTCEQAHSESERASASDQPPDRSRLVPLALGYTWLAPPKPNREPILRLHLIGLCSETELVVAPYKLHTTPNSSIRSEEGLRLETSAFEFLYGGQFLHIINPVDKTQLSCYIPHWRSATVSLEHYPLYSCIP